MNINSEPLTIISAGQSNIDGRVPVKDMPNPIKLPISGCHYCSNYTPNHEEGVFQDKIEQSDLSADRFGFDLVTYYYLTQVAKRELYVMKCSEGGTSIAPTGEGGSNPRPDEKIGHDHWTTEIDKLKSPDHSLLLQFKQIIESCMNATDNQLTVNAMLWHQGEGDRADFSQEAADNYYDNLKAVFKACRKFANQPDLPIFTGTISHHSTQYDPKVEAGLLKLAKEDSNLHVIDLHEENLLDNFHFNAQSTLFFGQAIYNEMIGQGILDAPTLALKNYRTY